MKTLLLSVIDSIMGGLLKIRSKLQPPSDLKNRIQSLQRAARRLDAESMNVGAEEKLPCLTEIMEEPLCYAEIVGEAMCTLAEEAYMAACELQSPNSPDFGEVEDAQLERLQEKFWSRFTTEYLNNFYASMKKETNA